MNWLRRLYNRWRYRPTLSAFWKPENGQRIVSVTPWRDLLVVATEYEVFVVTHGHPPVDDLAQYQIRKIAVMRQC